MQTSSSSKSAFGTSSPKFIESRFEVLGYSEDLFDLEQNVFLGSRTVEKPDRPTGTPGAMEFTLTETLALRKGHRHVVVKASKERPLKVLSILQIVCGRAIRNGRRT